MYRLLLLLILITASLASHQLTINSERVTGLPQSSNYCLIHTGKVTVNGTQVGRVTCNRLDVHLNPKAQACTHITAHNVAWRHPQHTVVAQRIMLEPEQKKGTAIGNVRVYTRRPDGTTVVSRSQRAQLNL